MGSVAFAQRTDTAAKAKPAKAHSVRKAVIMSACLPGLGQAYNKKYWKVPVIYAGFGGLGYAFNFNQTRYVQYRDAYKYRVDGDANTVDEYVNIYTDDNLLELKNYYHRYRDLTVVGGVLLYTLNIIDAAVDAHLFSFDVSDNLSLNIVPYTMGTACTEPVQGIGLRLNF